MTLLQLLQYLLNGLVIGSIYALFAIGYTLLFSILDILNFAQGAIFTLGAYFAYVLTGSRFESDGLLSSVTLPFGVPFPVALLLGGIAAGLCGILLDRFLFRPLRQRGAESLLAMIASLGANIAIVNTIQYLAGTENYSFPPNPFGAIPAAINFGTPGHPIPVRTIPIIIFVISLVVFGLLTLWITRTKTGKALQAVAQDPLTARLLGINPDRLILLTFFVSGLLGGMAGALTAVSFSISGPYFADSYSLKGVSVIILGGLGSVPGAIVGGLALGLIEAFVPSQYNASKDAIAFALMFVVLLLRPQGLLGRSAIQKV